MGTLFSIKLELDDDELADNLARFGSRFGGVTTPERRGHP
jgi:hypothetical protein